MSAILFLAEPERCEPFGEQVMFRRPMVDLGTAMAMLDLSEQQLKRAIEHGRIRWAFNLGVGARNHVQILVRSLANYTDRSIILPASAEGVADMVLPQESATSGTVRGTELQFALNIRSQHVRKLLDAGMIAESESSQMGRGRSGSATFTRESIVRLLVTRRMK